MRTFSQGLGIAVLCAPLVASAQNMTALLGTVGQILNALVYILVTLAIVVFFWGLVRYLASASGQGKSDGLRYMLWGIVTIFVMVSIWGIIAILQNTTGTGDVGKPPIDLDVERHVPKL